MGLLSDPEYGSVKWVRVLKKIHKPLCFLCYIAALVWFVMLGNREFNNDTYFSENALLPGLVTNDFNQEGAARKFYDDFRMELEKYEDTDEMPVPWLVGMMSQLRLEVYTHNFTLNYPMGNGQVFKGTNVYGILRAPRTSSLEALVVTTPYRPPSSHQKSTNAGIALMLAFAQFARPQKYWAKDIIFLITEHEQLGMQAWLEAYHGIQSEAQTFHTSLGSFWKPGTPSLDLADLGLFQTSHNKCLNPGKLKARSGSIQAAINLELHTPKIKYIEVKVEGLNGQLPNLDLVNLVHKLSVKSGIHHSYKNSYSWTRPRNKMEDWLTSVKNMLSMISSQATGVPNGNHGLFHRFGIEAVTLEGRDENDPAGRPPRMGSLTPANFHKLGVALESILRSLNNLLERFHQSYFFYLLASTQRFISIGQYMPALCLLCVAVLIRALALWVTIQQDDDEEKAKKHKRKHKTKRSEVPSDQEIEELNPKSDSNDETAAKEKGDPKLVKKEESSISVVNVGANYLLVHLLGYAVMNSPLLLCQIGLTTDTYLRSELSIFNGLSFISLVLMAVSPRLLRVMRSGPMTYEELSLVNIMLLVELATVCLCVGMHNFALGLILAVVYTPLALIAGVSTKKRRTFGHYLRRGFCIFVHPLLLVTLCLISYSAFEFPEDSWLEMFRRGRDAAIQAVMFSIVDSMIYGNWLFNLMASTILPIWTIFWQILCNSADVTRI